jgi:hypothetical protein
MESYIVAFDHCRHTGIRLPIMSQAGPAHELRWLDIDEELSINGVHFVISEKDGSNFVTGIFVGSQRDRDVPLEIARIFARELASPMRLEYTDGIAYRYDARFDCAVRETAA